MEQHSQKPETALGLDRLRRYSHGAQLIFENAEALYNEAQTLGELGAFSRATVLHQISMEECAKIDMLGARATSLLMGRDVDDAHMEKIFREHKLKNYANAYNATPTPAEQEARARGDWKASSEAFKKFQRDFHGEVNTVKNAGLYVDFKDGQFTAPKGTITEEMAVAFMHMNADFLRRSEGFVRLLRKMEAEPQKHANWVRQFAQRAEALHQEGKFNPEEITEKLVDEMRADAGVPRTSQGRPPAKEDF